MTDFTFTVTPQLSFGRGKMAGLPAAIGSFGKKVLLVTGAHSFLASANGRAFLAKASEVDIHLEHYCIDREPSPSIIDDAVKKFSSYSPDCVLAIGGGSVLDGGKAISAMLPLDSSVKNYLEGMGTKPHPGKKVPFIAVPTTSGTGSEATKNAVLSEPGDNGYKRSLRHNNFVPNLAIVDPLLTVGCPPFITATSGMDAFTQLLESYLSTTASPITDALAVEGLKCVAQSLKDAYNDGTDLEARTAMALASYLSGLTLANAGLGLVHGFASPIGGYFSIPHGVICSALMAPANELTIRKLRMNKTNPGALTRYSRVGSLFAGSDHQPQDYYIDFLLDVIRNLAGEFHIPPLSKFGVGPPHYEKIVSATDNKNNPIVLNAEEMMQVLEKAG